MDSQIQNAIAIAKHREPLGKYMHICEEQDLLGQSNFQSLIDQFQLGLEEVSDAPLSVYEWAEKTLKMRDVSTHQALIESTVQDLVLRHRRPSDNLHASDMSASKL